MIEEMKDTGHAKDSKMQMESNGNETGETVARDLETFGKLET